MRADVGRAPGAWTCFRKTAKAGVMRRITLTVVPALLAGAAAAEPTQVFFKESGQITRAASTQGSITTHPHAPGRTHGTAARQRRGPGAKRGASGRLTRPAPA